MSDVDVAGCKGSYLPMIVAPSSQIVTILTRVMLILCLFLSEKFTLKYFKPTL